MVTKTTPSAVNNVRGSQVSGGHAAPPVTAPKLAGGTGYVYASRPVPDPKPASNRLFGRPPKKKIELITMWATYCEPCKREMPGLIKKAIALSAKGVKTSVVAEASTYSLDASRAMAQKWIAENNTGLKVTEADGTIRLGDNIEFTFVTSPAFALRKKIGIRGASLPATGLVIGDKSTFRRNSELSTDDYKKIDEAVDAALKK